MVQVKNPAGAGGGGGQVLYIEPGEAGLAERRAEEALKKLGWSRNDEKINEVLREYAPGVDATLFNGIVDAVRIYDSTGYDGGSAPDAAMVIVMLLSCAQNRASASDNFRNHR